MDVTTEVFTVDEPHLEAALELVTRLQAGGLIPAPPAVVNPTMLPVGVIAALDALNLTDTLPAWPWLPTLDRETLTMRDVASLITVARDTRILTGPGKVRLLSVLDEDPTGRLPVWRVGIELPGGPMIASTAPLHLSDVTDPDLDVDTPADLTVMVLSIIRAYLDDVWHETDTAVVSPAQRALDAGTAAQAAALAAADAGVRYAVDIPRVCALAHARWYLLTHPTTPVKTVAADLAAAGLSVQDLDGWPTPERLVDHLLTGQDVVDVFHRARATGLLRGPDVTALTAPPGPAGRLPGSGQQVVATTLGPGGVSSQTLDGLTATRLAGEHPFSLGGADLLIGLLLDLAERLSALLDETHR